MAKSKGASEKVRSVAVIPVISLTILIIIINLPDVLGKPFFSLTDKTNIVLTFVLAMFAVIQGYSAYAQVNMERKKYAVENASSELEKAYGPIYAILNKSVQKDKKSIELLVSEKLLLDEKLSTYRCMFSANIADYWEKNIRKTKPRLSTDVLASAKDLMRGNFSASSGMIDVYTIPLDFVEMFTAEYKKKIEKQQELLTEK